MLKIVRRFVREHFEKKVVNNKENVDNPPKQKSPCCCMCSTSFIPGYLKKINERFSYYPFPSKYDEKQKHQDKSGTFETHSLDPRWVETFGLSGTLALGWALSQNIDLKRKKAIQGLINLNQSENYYPLKRAFCPYYSLKNIFPKHVLAQPNGVLNVDVLVKSSDSSESDVTLPVYGPLTAEEALNEASEGLRKARNAAAGEFENRLGMRYMSKQRYRKAIIHFAAGSALQNSTAAYNLAQCYELGLGTSQDFTKAAKCYRKASELGDPTATFNLAVFYAQGLGGLKCDFKRAQELLEKAVKLGDPNAKSLMESLLKNKSPLHIENNVKLVPQSKAKEFDTTSNEEESRVLSSVVKPNLTTLRVPFSKITGNVISEIDSCHTLSSLNDKVQILNISDSTESKKSKDMSPEREFCAKQNDKTNEESLSYSNDDDEDILHKLLFSYEVPSGVTTKELQSPIPLRMKLCKMAGH